MATQSDQLESVDVQGLGNGPEQRSYSCYRLPKEMCRVVCAHQNHPSVQQPENLEESRGLQSSEDQILSNQVWQQRFILEVQGQP